MHPPCARLIAACLLLPAAAGYAVAGGVHIRYGPDAPARLAAQDILYYEGVLRLEHHHPAQFALEHPFYTRMFEDQAMLDRLLLRWEAHEQRFEYWHDCLWKVLNGYRASHLEPLGGLAAPGYGVPIEVGGGGADDRGQGQPAPTGAPGGTGPKTAAVPEPSSGLLLVLGLLGAGSFWVLRVRVSR